MDIAEQVIAYAGRLFDVVGCSRPSSGGESLLILGLESTPERDLDEFSREKGHFWMPGFKKYIGSGVESVVNFLREKGFSAEAVGWYGYPSGDVLSLKEEAIRAGLGKRGKSTVVLHPKYGPWLRLAAVRTDALLEPTADLTPEEEESPFCKDCTICIDVCPVSVLEPYRMLDASICLSNTTIIAEEGGQLIPCDECLHKCPAGRVS